MMQNSSLVSIGQCPKCGGGSSTGCFAVWNHAEHCFTCGYHKVYDACKQYYTSKLTMKKSDNFQGLPDNLVQEPSEFGVSVLKWLYNYYIFDIRKYGIRYSERKDKSEHSLILPTIQNDEIVGYQRRCFPDKKFYTKGDKYALETRKEQDYIVIVEDIISFYRLSNQHNCIGMLGTSITDDTLSEIIHKFRTFIFWTDKDEAGNKAREKLKAQINRIFNKKRQKLPKLYLTATKYLDIVTENDPKCYSDEEIKQEIRRILL